MAAPGMPERGAVIGAPVTVGDVDAAASAILAAAEVGKGGYVCVANVHMVTTARTDPVLLAAMEGALWVASDGMPLVWALRCHGHEKTRRVAGPDLMRHLLQEAETARVPVYFFGGNGATVTALRPALESHFPTLRIAGIEAPPLLPLAPEVDSGTVARINDTGARLVFVGLGCPKQEYWMAAYAPHLTGVQIGVGAAFDFFAGTLVRAPRWMQAAGLEWLFRLWAEPRRLWRRYLVTNSRFIWYVLASWLRSKTGRVLADDERSASGLL